MKIPFIVCCLLGVFFKGGLSAQSKFCDELVHVGDTFICRDFIGRGNAPAREHYYVFGRMVFTRRWYYLENGMYYFMQFRSRWKYARKHGPSCSYYDDGTPMVSTVYDKGNLVGPCRYYYPNGELKHMCERHIKGAQDGIEISFYPNGLVRYKAKWNRGRLRQILRYKDEAGKDLPVGTFKDGDGTWIQYENGQAYVVYVYKKGKLLRLEEPKGQD